MVKPRTSVIIPTYNRAYTLAKAIGSIKDQTITDWECIVVDDGSTDETEFVVNTFADDRIRYFSQANAGQSAARNYGLDKADGEWILYLDSDDALVPQALETMLLAVADKPEVVFAFPNNYRYLELYEDNTLQERIDQTKDTQASITVYDIAHRRVKVDFNAFMHRSDIDSNIRFDESMRRMEDWDFMLQLGTHYPDGMLYVPEVLYTYVQKFGGDGAVSATDYQGWADTFSYVYNKHKDSSLLAEQGWYPAKVEKWQRLADQYEKDEIPPYYLYYFKNHWPKKYARN